MNEKTRVVFLIFPKFNTFDRRTMLAVIIEHDLRAKVLWFGAVVAILGDTMRMSCAVFAKAAFPLMGRDSGIEHAFRAAM